MMLTSRFSLVEKAVYFLLLVYPTAMLTIQGGMNRVFLCMLVLVLLVWMLHPSGIDQIKWQPAWTLYTVAMFSMSIAILGSQLWNQSLSPHPYDAAARYWLGIPVFLLLVRLRLEVLFVVQIAFPVAVISGFLLSENVWGRSGLGSLDVIHFGDFELMLGALSLFTLDWTGRDRAPLRLLKILGFIAGVMASIASGARGGWLAIPVFIAIFVYFNRNKLSLQAMASYAAAVALSVFLLYSFNTSFHQRIEQLTIDFSLYKQGDRDTSTGIRWQLYRAALQVFYQHPVFGVGPEGLALQMQPMREAGELTPLAAEVGRGEVHSDLLSKTVGMGIFGLASMLAVYAVPFGLFWHATAMVSSIKRRAGVLGIIFVSGFMVFGLTVEILNLTMATAFYSFTIAVLLAACYNIHGDGQG